MRDDLMVARNSRAAPDRDYMLDLLRYLTNGTRGGETRSRLLSLLLERPRNAHKIARELGLNYGTVVGHLRKLVRAGLVIPLTAERYSQGFAVAPVVRQHAQVLRSERGRSTAARA